MSEKRNKLLARQLRKHFPDGVPPGMEGFLNAVDSSYAHYDADRDLMSRAMEISSKELIEKNQELESKNAALDSFIYRVSHDLKTPAHNVISLVGLLRKNLEDRSPSPTVTKMLDLLESASDGMLVRLKDLLELTRIEKSFDTNNEPIEFEQIIQEVLATMSEDITDTQASFETDFADCPVVLFGRENMRSLLYNLAGNAIKYRSPDRKPHVELVSKRHGPWVVLTISDNGMGMDLDKNGSKLFGMFNRFHSHVEGTGVGLYIVKKIVEGYGGRIEVESTINKGTTFRLFLRHQAIPAMGTPEPV